MVSHKATLLALCALLAIAPAAYATGYSGSCSTCAKATTGLPYTVPSWSFKTGCPRPSMYNSRTGSAPTWAIPVGLCCGVEGYPPCPAISCAYSFSYSSSGPSQCASSYAVIKAASVSQTQYNSDIKEYVIEDLKSYCATYPPTQEDVIAHAAAQASAMAEATATTLIYHNQMVCLNKFQYAECATCSTCAGGKAKTVVKAAVQAVANAAAESWAGAYAEVLNSGEYDPNYGAMLASASADAAAVANAVNIAYDTFADKLTLKGSTSKYGTAASCKTDGPQTECKTAIAQVLTCVFVDALASVYTEPSSGIIQPDSTSCANSYSISYSIGNELQNLTCPYEDCVPPEADCEGADCEASPCPVGATCN